MTLTNLVMNGSCIKGTVKSNTGLWKKMNMTRIQRSMMEVTAIQKYLILSQLAKPNLAISHSQADIELGFLRNKHTVTSRRVHLGE